MIASIPWLYMIWYIC